MSGSAKEQGPKEDVAVYKELIANEVKDGRNKNPMKCKFCPSRILNPNVGIFAENTFSLPLMAKRKDEPSDSTLLEYEKLSYFWQINDMYMFENICFSNTVGNVKYLACADCEIGPVGYFNMDSKISYIAVARVNYISRPNVT